MRCFHCEQEISPPGEGHCGTGYARDKDDHVICYACCAWLDVFAMLACKPGERFTGAALYVTSGDGSAWSVTNWPGTLKMWVTGEGGTSHVPFTFRGKKRRVYFVGPHGSSWSGTFYDTPTAGDLLRDVRRLKEGRS